MRAESPYKADGLARLIRPMNELEYKGLLDDVKINGQREEIVLLTVDGEDFILDGLNREKACRALGVEPKYRHYNEAVEGPPHLFVISKNFARRMLSDWDAASAAQRLAAYVIKKNKERAKKGERILPGVTEHTQEMASTIKADAEPELVEALDAGLVDMPSAAAMAAYEPELQRRMVEEIKADAEKPAPIVRAKAKHEGIDYAAGELSPTDIAALVTLCRIGDKSVHAEAGHGAMVLRRMVPGLGKQ